MATAVAIAMAREALALPWLMKLPPAAAAASFARYESHVTAIREVVQAVLRDGVAAGAFHAELDVELQATFLLQLMNSARAALDRDSIPPGRVGAALKDLLHHGLLRDDRETMS